MRLFNLDRYRSVSAELVLVGLFVVLAIGTVAVLDARAMQEQHLEVKKEELHGQVDSMISLMGYFESLAEQGVISEEEAQTAAMGAVREVRYAGEEYFWIQDHSATVLMHPIKPELDNTDQSQLADENGVQLFTEFVDTVEADGGGYVGYLWPKGDAPPTPKVSYVAGFEPWGWIIGTGVWEEDISVSVGDVLGGSAVATTLLVLAVIGLIVVTRRGIVGSLGEMHDALDAMADGDFSRRLPEDDTEFGRVGAALNRTQSRLADSLGVVATRRSRCRPRPTTWHWSPSRSPWPPSAPRSRPARPRPRRRRSRATSPTSPRPRRR